MVLNRWSRTSLLAGAALAAVLFAAPAADASPVLVRDGNGGNLFGAAGFQTLSITVNNAATNVQAGAFYLQYSQNVGLSWTDFITYCLEPDEVVGNLGLVGGVSGDLLGLIGDSALYASSADSLMQLYATWFTDSLTSATKSAAFQVAVWELAYDTGSSLAAGAFQFTPGPNNPVLNQATAYLNSQNWGPAEDLGLILRVGNQDFTVELPTTSTNVVPEPGTLALFGLGLAGLAAARRRRRTAA